ncbi:MAG: hypothetical protein ACI81W_004282, partial [Saprospiraceae bacterium]
SFFIIDENNSVHATSGVYFAYVRLISDLFEFFPSNSELKKTKQQRSMKRYTLGFKPFCISKPSIGDFYTKYF